MNIRIPTTFMRLGNALTVAGVACSLSAAAAVEDPFLIKAPSASVIMEHLLNLPPAYETMNSSAGANEDAIAEALSGTIIESLNPSILNHYGIMVLLHKAPDGKFTTALCGVFQLNESKESALGFSGKECSVFIQLAKDKSGDYAVDGVALFSGPSGLERIMISKQVYRSGGNAQLLGSGNLGGSNYRLYLLANLQ